MIAQRTIAPVFGAIFEHAEKRYRVTGYMRRAVPPPESDWIAKILFDASQELTRDNVRLEWCPRANAEYVTGAGVAGCVVPVADVRVVGMVQWDKATLDTAEKASRALWGEILA